MARMKRQWRWLAVAMMVGLAIAGGRPRHAAAQAAPSAVSGEILVGFKPGTAATTAAGVHRQTGAQVARTLDQLNMHVLRVPPGQEAATIAAYRRNPNVRFAEINGRYRVTAAPNDPMAAQQWQYRNTGGAGAVADADIDAWEAWSVTDGNPSVAIAILDTGIDQSHEDLAAKIVRNVNFSDDASWDDGHGHGTHVAGTAAAITNNGVGVAGTCPRCSLYNVKVMNNDGTGSWESIANGIIWAADNGAKVINLSVGGTDPSDAIQAAVEYAWNAGVVVVAGAGNDGVSTPFYPAAYPNVIAVAATDKSDAKAFFSNFGSYVDVAAPGVDILSTAPDHFNNLFIAPVKYGTLSGTSMASPHVAGVAGLVWSSGLCTTNACVRSRIESSADPISGTGSLWASGRVNACNAVGGSCISAAQNHPPSVTLVSPSEGAALNGAVTVQVRATDADESASTLIVDWRVDTGAWQRATFNPATGNHESAWDTSTVTAGAHTVTARVTDGFGATATDSSAVFAGVESTGRMAFGEAKTVTISTANKIGLVQFDGTAGQRASIKLSAVTITSVAVSLINPDGTKLGTTAYTGTYGGFIDAQTLPSAGAYTIVVDPQSTYTGSITLSLYDVPGDAAASAAVGGPPVSLSVAVPGQNAAITFSGTSGRRVSINVTGVTISTSYVSVVNPDGTTLVARTYVGTTGKLFDPVSLPASGTYKVLIDPQSFSTGSMTFTLVDVPPDITGTITLGGPSLTVTTTAAYQNARLTFSGTAGQRVSVGMTSVTMGASTCCGVKVSILNPSGGAFVYPAFVGTAGGDIDTNPLPSSGAYTIVVDPQDVATGSMTLTLSTDVTGALTVGGPAQTATITRAGQNARLTFDGVAGQTVSLTLSGGTIGTSTCCGVDVTVLRPDGTTLLIRFAGTATAVSTLQLTLTGTYQIVIDPKEAKTGSITLSLTGPVAAGGTPISMVGDAPDAPVAWRADQALD